MAKRACGLPALLLAVLVGAWTLLLGLFAEESRERSPTSSACGTACSA